MKTSRILTTLAVAGGIAWAFGYFSTQRSVDAGEVGIVVAQPILFGNDGVRDEVLMTGRHNVAWTSNLVRISTAPQTAHVHIDDMIIRVCGSSSKELRDGTQKNCTMVVGIGGNGPGITPVLPVTAAK